MRSEPVAVYLGLGSNLGNRQENMDRALGLLSQRLGALQISSVYDTEPIGNINQPRFLNMVCQAYTRLAPMELLTLVKGIELKLGRAPGKPNAPAPLILIFSSMVTRLLKSRGWLFPTLS